MSVSDLRAVEAIQWRAYNALRELPAEKGFGVALSAVADAIHAVATMRIDAEADLRRWAAGRCGEPSLWRRITEAVDRHLAVGEWMPTERIVAAWIAETGAVLTEDERAALVRKVDEHRHTWEVEARRALSAPGIAGEARSLPVWAGAAQ